MPETLDLKMCGFGPRKSDAGRRRSDGSPSKRDTPPRRTTFHEDGLHVGTIVEYVDDGGAYGFCTWTTAGGGDQAPTYTAAEAQLRADLLR